MAIVITTTDKLPDNCHFCLFRYMHQDGHHRCSICHAIINYDVINETKYNECPLKECK